MTSTAMDTTNRRTTPAVSIATIDTGIEVPMDSCSTSQTRTTVPLNRKPTTKEVCRSKVFLISVSFSSIIIVTFLVGFIVHATIDVDHTYDDALRESIYQHLPMEQKIWYDRGVAELRTAIQRDVNRRRAKNVILFVGDGMGPNTVTAARIYGFKEEGLLSWEQFPNMGMLKTYCADKQVPDSFSTATALFGGVKINYETGGVDASVSLANCSAAQDPSHHVHSIMEWAQLDGMRTGFVTTTRVTHATPAALYAHVPDRRWECEDKMPAIAKEQRCKDIARQLIEDRTGQHINVIMGGGRQMLVSDVADSPADPIDTWSCYSKDGRDLISDWSRQKASNGYSHAVVKNTGELRNLTADIDYVLGIFANGHLKYDYERDKSDVGMPSLKDMTLKAIDILQQQEDKRFLLVVEGGMIDQAHHRGTAKKALSEVLAMHEAVEATIHKMKHLLDETLIIVTADHSHTLTLNGYAAKGSNILGVASNSKTEGIPYTTLTYGTSYKGFQPNANGLRSDPTLEDTTAWEYPQQAAINTDENTHGGSDVTVHARGAMSHLFHGVHEQSYVAHVIAYALRIGRFRDSRIAESLADLI